MNYTPEFFKPSEFVCPCCGRGRVTSLLVLWLDLLRRAWREPIAVNSGWRCAPHNAEVGGAERSRHLIGCAADIRPVPLERGRTLSKEDFAEFCDLTRHFCGLPGWELRFYNTFIHVAVPRDEAGWLWNGGAVALACR